MWISENSHQNSEGMLDTFLDACYLIIVVRQTPPSTVCVVCVMCVMCVVCRVRYVRVCCLCCGARELREVSRSTDHIDGGLR
jgi:hypothetical protein